MCCCCCCCSCRTGGSTADEVAACRAPIDIGAETQGKALDIQEIGKTLAALVKHVEAQSAEMHDMREAVTKLQMQSAAISEERIKTGDDI